MLFALFSPDTTLATVDVVSSVSDLGLTSAVVVLSIKLAHVATAARLFLEAQTKAMADLSNAAKVMTDATVAATSHLELTRAHQLRLEALIG
jgi:hypothetical protein